MAQRFLAFGVGLDPRQQKLFGMFIGPLAVGCSVGLTSFATAGIFPGYSGASMHPARCFAFATSRGDFRGKACSRTKLLFSIGSTNKINSLFQISGFGGLDRWVELCCTIPYSALPRPITAPRFPDRMGDDGQPSSRAQRILYCSPVPFWSMNDILQPKVPSSRFPMNGWRRRTRAGKAGEWMRGMSDKTAVISALA